VPAIVGELLEGQCKHIWQIEVVENNWKLLQQGFASKVDQELCKWKKYVGSLRDLGQGHRKKLAAAKSPKKIAQVLAKIDAADAKLKAVVANHRVSSVFNRQTGQESCPSVSEKYSTKGDDGMLKLKKKQPGGRFHGMIVNISVSGALSADLQLKIKGITMATSSAKRDWPARALRCTQVTRDDG